MQEMTLFSKNYSRGSTYKLELRRDLLGDWVVSRHYNRRRKMQVFSNYSNALKAFSKAEAGSEKRGYIPLIKKTFNPCESEQTRQQQNASQIDQSFPTYSNRYSAMGAHSADYLIQAVQVFMENTDWIDITNCFEMSADEFADANWKRFKSWLSTHLKQKTSDQEIFIFSFQVWERYREATAL